MVQSKSNTDNELMLQIVGYNSEAFQQLFNRYSPSILGLIKEIISNPKLADKVLLNVFSVFLKRSEYFSTTTSNVYTYLTLLARNISLDVYRRMKFAEDIPIYSDEYEIEFILPRLSQSILQIDLDERYVLGEKIKSYRSQLTEIQNLLLSLIYFEGLNEEEIAKRLNVPMVTVRQKVLNILDVLYKHYTGHNTEQAGNKAVLELIKLEALGFLTAEERMMLMNLKENDPDFMWKELGEFQNLTAIISAAIPEQMLNNRLDEEVKQIFTQIFLQDGDVEYPIIPTEIPIPEPEPESITAPSKQANNNQLKSEESTKTETKSSGFQLKFREPDPTELNILRKLEKAESKPETKSNPAPVFNRVEKKIVQQEVKPVADKPDVVFNRIKNSPAPKEVVTPAIVKEENQIQNKSALPQVQIPELVNDNPSIIIEEPKPVVAKTEEQPVSKLTPTSSINIDDIIKKENKPAVKRNTLVENSRLANTVQSKQPIPEIAKQEVKTKDIELPKVISDSKPVVESKPEIQFKVNQPPKEIKPTLPIIEKPEQIVEPAAVKTPVEKFEIKFRTNEPPKEIKPASPLQRKADMPNEAKQEKPVPPQSEIKFRSVEPPKEINKVARVNPVTTKPVEIKSASPIGNNTVEERKSIEVQNVKEPTKQKSAPAKEVKQPETKVAENILVDKKNLKSEDALKLNSLFKSRERKEEVKQNVENATGNKPSLKIRETKFVEDEIKQPITPKIDPKIEEIKSVVENLLKDKNLTGTISVNEVLAKLEAEKTAIEEPDNTDSKPLFKDFSYEEEIEKINKQSRKKVFVYAAIFVVLAVSGIFAYLNMQLETTKVAGDVKNNKPNVVNESAALLSANDNEQIVAQEVKLDAKVEEKVNAKEDKTVTDPKIKLPPLPENLDKQESTYFALNEKNDLNSNQQKENTQTAAAKTENIIPPKENKVKEEEPAFFVAVEEMPQLVGGLKELQTKIKYPEIAKKTGIEGKVLIQAIVDENGNVTSANTIKGIGGGCDDVALNAVLNSKFTPGKQRGKNVKVQVTIPIVFKK
jgi:periplasmic protein TonB